MNDLDQETLASRLAEALMSRIQTSLESGDMESANKDLRYLLSFEGRGEAEKMVAIYDAVHALWPQDDASRAGLADQLQAAQQRVARQAQSRQISAALRDTSVHPLRDVRALPQQQVDRIAAIGQQRHEWPLPPVFHDTWENASTDQLLGDLALVNRAMFDDAFFQMVLRIGVVAGRRCSIAPYDATMLEFLLDGPPGIPARSAVFLVGAFGALALEGTSPRIHALNAMGLLNIDSEERAAQYLKMFTGVVHGEDGPFTIASSRDHVLLAMTDIAGMPQAADTIGPLVLTRPGDMDGKHLWLAEGTVIYSNAIFTARFGLLKDGTAEMLDDEPIAANLPIRQPCFVEGLRQFVAPETPDAS